MTKEELKKFAEDVYETNAIGEKYPFDKDSYMSGFIYGYNAAEASLLDLGLELKLPTKIAWTEFTEDSEKLHYSTQDEFEKCSNRKILGIDDSRPVGAQVSHVALRKEKYKKLVRLSNQTKKWTVFELEDLKKNLESILGEL